MIRHILVCSLLTIALSVSSQTADYNIQPSPCPDVFTYEPLGINDQPLSKRWYGVIKLSTDVTLHAVWLNVILDRKADILGNWMGDVTTKDNLNFKIVNDQMKLFPGEPKTVRFFIQYSHENKPEIQSILFNGREICNDSKFIVDETISKPNNYNIFNGAPISTDTTTTTIPTVSEITRDNFYDNSQTKIQNKQTTTSKPNYYVQVTTEIVKNNSSTHVLQIKNQTQSISGTQWRPQNKTENRQHTISTPVKDENKVQSTPVVGRQQTVSQTWPQIKATLYQQALIDKLPSTESYTQANLGSTKVNNSLLVTPINRPQVINSDKKNYQQLRPNGNQINTFQTTTVNTLATVSYPSTTEIYNSTVRPNIQITPDERSQDDRPSISETYGDSNIGNNEQNSGILDSNFQQAYLPVRQFAVPDSTQNKMITVNIQVPTNHQQRKPVETVPIQAINSVQNFNDERREESIRQQSKPISKPTSTIPWSNTPSDFSYGSTGSQLAKPNNEGMDLNVHIQLPLYQHDTKPVPEPATVIEGQEDDDKYPFIGLPIYIPNFKPEENCGKVTKKPPHILPFGSSTSEGQWPWQAAIYQQQTVHFKYICGGTLVSHRHVVTAAHCVTRRKSMRLVNQHTLTVYLGKFNLRTSVEGVQVMFVNQISVHPSYNSTSFSRDLAILELRDSAKYTPWVRPACLWPEDETSLSSIVGRTGSVVSWGVESSGITQTELNLLEMPIVNQETCMSSYNFYERFTSAHTYCARYKDDNELCNGDSGGGMVFKKDNSWYLRGVVSVSVISQMDYHCDSNQYIIFTDVAKFLPWIMDHIDL